jgi:prophage regulatory protein
MAERMLRLPDVQAKTGLARATIYLRMTQGKFPKPVPLGSPHVVGWLESEVDEWIEEQVRAARPEPADAA